LLIVGLLGLGTRISRLDAIVRFRRPSVDPTLRALAAAGARRLASPLLAFMHSPATLDTKSTKHLGSVDGERRAADS
jgi:hypothetical protein